MQPSKLIFIILLPLNSFTQTRTDSLLQNILLSNKDSIMQKVIQNASHYRLQIIYTQINRNKHNKPSFTNYYYNVNSKEYFNPASTVKLPLAFLALEKLNNIHIKGVDKFTSMQFDSAWQNQAKEYIDSTSLSGLPSIAQFIRKAFLVSDNDAYNRLYEFVDQETINRNLHAKGYKDVRITRQFMGFSADENRHTNPINFIDKKGNVIYGQPMAYNRNSFDFSEPHKIGNAYYNSKDSLIHEPIDFTMHNNLPLEHLQQLLQSFLFPFSVPKKQRFYLTKEDRSFLLQYLSQYSSETNYPKYDTTSYYDSYVKFFFRAGSHFMPPNVRVFNKVGWAYGFLTDVSYVVDFKNNIEYMLTATVYVNEDGILNDDKYEYEQTGWPFLYQLGNTIYNYELKRERKYIPELDDFKINYEKRMNDNRPAIKEVDN